MVELVSTMMIPLMVKKTQSDMNKGGELVRKNLLQKYNEMNKDIDF
jgi:hypothetical protein